MKVQDSLAYPPRGLRASRAAAYLGMSENSFLNLVEEGKMPKPLQIGG
jgi:predicted DNA-binding transcriptional regulator AlpA